MGDGSSFWHSRWCDGICLRDRFPSLFAVAPNRDACVSDHLEHSPSLVVLASVFVRAAFPEDDSVSHFFAMLDTAPMRGLLS